ncbi:MAG: hypothetical protein Q7J27_06380 [Syntrophales bacterium]|nr:hypothetical protein [Syntrophales bacterium]
MRRIRDCKNTLESFEQAKRFVDNPELIKQRLEESLEIYAREKVGQIEGVKKIKQQMEGFEERIKKIEEEKRKQFENYQLSMARGVITNFKETIEERVGLKDKEKIIFVETLVKEYQFVKGGGQSRLIH